MGWSLATGGTGYPCKSLNFTRQVDAIDSVIVELETRLTPETWCNLRFNSDIIFYGYVKTCNQVSPKTYSILITERAIELKTQLARTVSGNTTVTVDNSSATKTIHDYVHAIIGTGTSYGSRYTDGTGSTMTTIPGTSTPLPSMQFTSMYRLAALDKFLKNTCGYMYWFDQSSKTIYYGDPRAVKTTIVLHPLDVREQANSALMEYTEVIVYGKSTNTKGTATTGSPPYKTIQYQYTDYADDTELTRIAEQILRDKMPQGLRYEMDLTIQESIAEGLNPGDLITVTWPMESISDTGIIKDMKYGAGMVTLGIGDKEISAYDLLDEKLQIIEGVSSVGIQSLWTPGWYHIDDNVPVQAVFDIEDLDLINDDFILYLKCYKWVKDLTTLPSFAAMSADLALAGLSVDKALAGMVAAREEAGLSATKVVSGTSNLTSLVANQTDVAMGSGYTGELYFPRSYPSYYNLCDSDYSHSDCDLDYIDEYTFAIINVSFKYRSAVSGMVYLKSVTYENGSGAYSDSEEFHYKIVGDGNDHVLSVSFLAPGHDYIDHREYQIWIACSVCDLYITYPTFSVAWLYTHSHDVSEPNGGTGHETPLIEPGEEGDRGHDTTLREPGPTGDKGHATVLHEPGYTTPTPGHATTLKEPNGGTGHETNEDDVLSEITEYPENLDIYVKKPSGIFTKVNSSPYAAGGETIIPVAIAQSFFGEGENIIKIVSTNKGCIYLIGSYTSFGDIS